MSLTTVRRDGKLSHAASPPRKGCRTLVEVWADDGLSARSDGRAVAVSYGFVESVSDNDIAVVLAHELAHAILEHRRRLSEAGVDKGFFGEFGKDRRLSRQAEIEADRLSVHLLANAGYDPEIAPPSGVPKSGARSAGDCSAAGSIPLPKRGRRIEREIRLYIPLGHGPTYPGHLLRLRDSPMR